MTPATLERPEAAHAWELRGAWAKGKEVRLTLDDICIIRTVVGRVTTVAATDAYTRERAQALQVLEQADRLTVYSPGEPTQ